jgi:N-acyl-phosphatidylethanolamine-hydrolysing phospholipase D
VTPQDAPPELRSQRDASGRFTNPWLDDTDMSRSLADIMRWQLQRLRTGRPPAPRAGELRSAAPVIARPHADPGELRITWAGQATFLVQAAGVNVLTDPVWSRRASPTQWFGPARLVPPGVPFAALPRIDAVILSHDHYDHLDERTLRLLHERHGHALHWVTPLGYADWLRRRGPSRITELDWWQEATLETPAGPLRVCAAPAQHWSKRSMLTERTRHWASFTVEAGGIEPVYFGGDSGYFSGYGAIGRLLGPFSAVLLPIGAYDPRWFMRAMHMNPEEAVRAYADLGATGTFAGMHWGTFRLTDEPPLEPPARARAAWAAAGLPASHLWLPVHGESRIIST